MIEERDMKKRVSGKVQITIKDFCPEAQEVLRKIIVSFAGGPLSFSSEVAMW